MITTEKAHALVAACLLLTLIGCHGYERRPLITADIIAEVESSIREPQTSSSESSDVDPSSVTLAQTARWMREHGPDVREAAATYRTALARASVSTPFPNPVLEVGPEWGFGPEVDIRRVMPFGSLGITIPIGGRLGRSDDLRCVQAEVARVDGLARHRELYLELRRRYSRLTVARRRQESRDKIVQSATRSSESVRQSIEAGQAAALDMAFFELEKGRAQAEHIEATASEDAARADLAAIVGIHESFFENCSLDDLPKLPQESFDREELKNILIDHHAGLARLRARYEEREATLRLEIAKQYPDLRIGPRAAGETGERKTALGLSIGIDLPAFDRNQQAVIEAEHQREEARVRYEEAVKRALVELDRSLRQVTLDTRRHRLLKDTILPQAKNSIELAHRSLAAGSGDALRLLDAERSYRTMVIQVLEAELDVRSAWTDLELAVGKPLIFFASENEANVPEAPDSLQRDPTDAQESSQ
jgi:cobalt-zinc-cadmium efflux system outer membrane protein